MERESFHPERGLLGWFVSLPLLGSPIAPATAALRTPYKSFVVPSVIVLVTLILCTTPPGTDPFWSDLFGVEDLSRIDYCRTGQLYGVDYRARHERPNWHPK
jgi:hypothetical protein